MIVRPLESLRQTAKRRPAGYLDDCLAVGTLSADGTAVAFTKEQFDALAAKYRDKQQATAGPRCLAGTALKSLLASLGMSAEEKGCQCKSRAAHMDAAGCDWCEANLDTIVGWLREEAQRRGLPFIDAAGRMLICRAIRNARRAAKG